MSKTKKHKHKHSLHHRRYKRRYSHKHSLHHKNKKRLSRKVLFTTPNKQKSEMILVNVNQPSGNIIPGLRDFMKNM